MRIHAPKWLPLSLITVTTVSGLFWMADYSSRPGPVGEILQNLADADSIPFSPSVQSSGTLLFFFHPHCPCTAATLNQLESITHSQSSSVQVVTVAFCPADQNAGWIESPTTQIAKRISGSTVVADCGAKTIRQFGVATSGHVLFYDANGQLLFSGGVTPGRGHEGDCPAADDLREKLSDRGHDFRQWPVFGCALYPPNTEQP